ncbi:hypothetical protein Z517_03858 [Fonsecaea pedrosoi CBS 271.37]|uniref:Uncharacterized protein n=1 Tax=Fonsecaea pedrosoi CBS 271.37 TaxID=1442368 RepID=A0A0D2GUD0_9EURO|nr:uncharacterized protein Z517_03858 [Fonsecaea pedrosoi CBS 271.37]KIW84608.1 hypothetical protein Z517_03858 [Fonsecaea pedrosoi CBS 271.37]
MEDVGRRYGVEIGGYEVDGVLYARTLFSLLGQSVPGLLDVVGEDVVLDRIEGVDPKLLEADVYRLLEETLGDEDVVDVFLKETEGEVESPLVVEEVTDGTTAADVQVSQGRVTKGHEVGDVPVEFEAGLVDPRLDPVESVAGKGIIESEADLAAAVVRVQVADVDARFAPGEVPSPLLEGGFPGELLPAEGEAKTA